MLDNTEYKEYIYKTYVNTLYDYGRTSGFNHDHCMDAIHDVFVKLFTNMPNIATDKIKPYLFICLKNRLIDLHRLNKLVLYEELDETLFSLELCIQDTYITHEEERILKHQLHRLLKDLTPKQQEILYLRYFQELEYEDIAKIMHISAESSRKLVYRTIKKIRSNPDIALPTITLIFSFLKTF